MASKTLTAKVNLNTQQFESKIKKIARAIDAINLAVGKQSNAYRQVNAALQENVKTTDKIKNKTKEWADSQRKVNSSLKAGNTQANALLTTVKRLASTYLGVMGTKAVITSSDTITNAENRLNALNGNDSALTQQSMDKIYSAAQRSRSDYGAMLKNVSKSMTLASEAFQGNVDNAIRFQEIMAKAYAIGGAEPGEASSSMYQLVQALGSGVLQGDELRSVREGAPLAYKAIEEFCQGVLNTDESLKYLASQGIITSDMVVAAIMDMENGTNNINDKFKDTATTFGQAWSQIKNTALKAFEPVLQRLNDILNSDTGKKAIEGITKALLVAANAANWLLSVFEKVIAWCTDNWEWLKYVILGVFTAMAVSAAWSAAKAIVAFIATYGTLLLIVAAVMGILYVYELWKQGTMSTVEAIIAILLILALACLVLGIVMGKMWLLWAAIALAVFALIMLYFAELCGFINVGIQAIVNAWYWCGNVLCGIGQWIAALFYNVGEGIADAFFGCVNWVVTLFENLGAWFGALGRGIANVFVAVCNNIGIAFKNAWTWAKNTFWDFLANVMEGCGKLEPVINGIAELLGGKGVDFSALANSIRGKKTSYTEYQDVGAAWNSAWDGYEWNSLTDAYSNAYDQQYKDLGDAWSKGYNTFDAFEDGWASDAYTNGYNWGTAVEDAINEWGSQFQNLGSENGILDDLSTLLGFDVNSLLGGLVDPNDPNYGVGGGYDPSGADDDILDALDKLNGNMELTAEDLDYLRRVADMEWKKEFTTASITVDMSNYNTINGEGDLDGIVDKLADKLYEEMQAVANGVYE